MHLPSIHVRRPDGSGFDYEEDLYFPDERAAAEFADVVAFLKERNAELQRLIENGFAEPTADEAEEARQARIAAGTESVCAGCGCSDSRGCEGGCVWATPTLCSRCV